MSPAETQSTFDGVGKGGCTSYHHVRLSMPDEVESVSNGVSAGGAGSGGCMVGPKKAVLHADDASCHVGQKSGDHERAQPAASTLLRQPPTSAKYWDMHLDASRTERCF